MSTVAYLKPARVRPTTSAPTRQDLQLAATVVVAIMAALTLYGLFTIQVDNPVTHNIDCVVAGHLHKSLVDPHVSAFDAARTATSAPTCTLIR
jgi:hypothetical protein